MNKSTNPWIKQAQRDLIVAKKLLIDKEYYAVAFFCQQAVEKGLKALYLKKYNRLLRIHDLVKLAREISVPERVLLACAKINPVYVEVRYPEEDEFPADKVSKAKAEELVDLVNLILEWAKKEI